MMEIHSWENDGDYEKTHTIYGLTEELAKEIGNFLATITSVHEQVLSDTGNERIKNACTTTILDYTQEVTGTNYLHEEDWDYVRNYVFGVFGLRPMNPDYYDVRIVDSIETTYAEFPKE